MKIKSTNFNLDDLLGESSNKPKENSKQPDNSRQPEKPKGDSSEEENRKKALLIQERRKKLIEEKAREEKLSQNKVEQKKVAPNRAKNEDSLINKTANNIKNSVQQEAKSIKESINKRLSNTVEVNYDSSNNQKDIKSINKLGEMNSGGDYDIAKLKAAGILVTASFEFAKSQYQRTMALLILVSLITFAVIGQTYYVANYKAPVKYIPVYEDKTIIDPIPLDKPVMSEDSMKQWLADSVSDIFSYNYLNLDKHGEKIAPYFTDQGYVTFKKEFDSGTDVARVRGQSLIVASSVVGSPLNKSGTKVSGRYAYWDWSFQLRQVFVSPNNKSMVVTYDVVATIIRQDQRIYRTGIAINSLRVVSSSEQRSN